MQKIKHVPIVFVILFTLMVASCGKSESSVENILAEGNEQNLYAKRKELLIQQRDLEDQIAMLDSAIAANTENTNIPLVTTFQLDSEEFYHYVELQGRVTTKQNILIYPEVTGILVKIHVKEGDWVKKGQLLGIIDNGGLENQLIQMKTQLQLAQTTYERQERLWEQKIGSEIQFLQAKTTYISQKNALDQMEEQINKFYLRAPFSGIIDDLMKGIGTVLTPGVGGEVFRLINLSNMYIEVLVPEKYIIDIASGKRVKIDFPFLSQTIETKVLETGNYINPDNRSFIAKIPVPNEKGHIKPNQIAKVKINDYYNKDAYLIPQSIVSENAEGDQYVYVVKKGKEEKKTVAARVIITTGRAQKGKLEVLSGLDRGANIILEGARSVKDGQQVKILTTKQ